MDPPEQIQVEAPPRSRRRGARSVELIFTAAICYAILSFFQWGGIVQNYSYNVPREFDNPAPAGGKTDTKIDPPNNPPPVDMDKSANNFTRFISYGESRTASTVQFNMVCVCFFLHMKVHKPTLANETKCYFQGKRKYNYPYPLDQPQVMKTHDLTHLEDLDAKASGIFLTVGTKERGHKLADDLKKSGGKVGLVQDLETLSEIKAVGFLDLYADFFDLSSQYLPMLHDYFTLWEKLRCCCGVQMSKYWRYELNPSTWGTKLDPHPFCGSLDIDVVEKAFMNTTIFKMIDSLGLGLRDINRPGTRDDELDGSYCSRYNEAVRTNGLKFNKKLG